MKFLVDQDVYAATTQFLRQLGHEVETASERTAYSPATFTNTFKADFSSTRRRIAGSAPTRRSPASTMQTQKSAPRARQFGQ